MRFSIKFSTLRRSIVAPIAAVTLLAPTIGVLAAQLPSSGSNLFIQTSGPNAGLNIGDYYTSPAGAGTDHLFLIRVPSNWPAGELVTIALYDPELGGPNPSSPAAIDEVRGAADSTTFSLESPSGGTVATRTYSDTSTNGTWAHLATFDPGVTGTGSYHLHVTVSDDDDNSWRIDASHDPDCSVGGPDTCTGVVDGDESDTAPSGSSRIGLGTLRTSYQHGSGGNQCQNHVFYVSSSTPRPLRAHNFDMDGNGSVTYTAPDGSTAVGTVSGGTRWNNSSDTSRVGDVLDDQSGWWTASLCVSNQNQYVFEAPGVSPTFPEPQPTPRLEVTKDDGESVAVVGDTLTYTIDVANVSDVSPHHGMLPGDAHEVVVSDVIPDGLSVVSCDVPAGGVCTEAGGTVTATLADVITPGASISIEIMVEVTSDAPDLVENTAVASYMDRLGNELADVSGTDVTDVEFSPVLVVVPAGPAALLTGDSAVVEFSVSHDVASDGSPVSSPVLACAVCSSTAFIDGDTNSNGDLDEGETWAYETTVDTDDTTPDPFLVTAEATGFDRDGDDVAADETHAIDIVEPGTIAGTVFEDLDGDGEYDFGEPGIDAADVGLALGGSDVASTTPSGGAFMFDRLFPGDYEASVDESALDPDLVATGVAGIASLAEGGAVTGVDFGFARPVTISGSVFADTDFDGVSGLGETGIEGVRVALIDGNGVVVSESGTDASGEFSFETLPGRYSVRVVGDTPPGWAFTTEAERDLGLVMSGTSTDADPIGLANHAPVLNEASQTITEGGTPAPLPWSDAEGGDTTFSIADGELPAGLTLNPDGSFSGADEADGVFNLTFLLCDNGSPAACATYEWQLVVLLPAPSEVGVTELPFTGENAFGAGMAGTVMLAAGGAVLLFARRTPDTE